MLTPDEGVMSESPE
jgi:hypothetical protein